MSTPPNLLSLASALRLAKSSTDAARALAAIEEAGPPKTPQMRARMRETLLDATFVQGTEDDPAPVDVIGGQLPGVYSAVAGLCLGDHAEDASPHDERSLTALHAVMLDEKVSAGLVEELVRQVVAAGKAELVTHVIGVLELRKRGVRVESPQWRPAPYEEQPPTLVHPLYPPPEVLGWRALVASTRVLVLGGLLLFLAGLVLGLLQY